MEYPKKLIEVALPLDDINVASAREKSIRHGHPSTLHLWWARRPLAAARAVLFAQLVNDPGGKRGYGKYKGQTKADAYQERERLFQIIRDLVKWENTNNEEVLERARKEIRKSWRETCEITGDDPEKMPPFLDPFAGGGSIPLEAQRLGLEAHASDLNPVAVMINKAMIEIPPKFAGREPVGPLPENDKQKKIKGQDDWSGAKGLAEDVRRYGQWMRNEVFKKIGHLYPQIELPQEHGEGQAIVVAWLWARTVYSPNPAYNDVYVPLVSSFYISTKKGKEAYVYPIIENNSYRFAVINGKPQDVDNVKSGTKLNQRATFRCLLSGVPISPDYIKREGQNGQMGAKLLAVVAEGPKGKVYLSPTSEMEKIAMIEKNIWLPTGEIPSRLTGGTCYGYGLTKWSSLFTSRQLVTLNTFHDLIIEVRKKVIVDALNKGMNDDGKGLANGGKGAIAYGDAIVVYLALLINQVANHSSSACGWNSTNSQMRSVFARQAIPMVWDYAECNPFSNSSGSFNNLFDRLIKGFETLGKGSPGIVKQSDAITSFQDRPRIISTDPPYYGNIAYSDLSDFFYVWLRRTLKTIFPSVFSTMLVPKESELVALAYRHGSKEKAEIYFLDGMKKAIKNIAKQTHSAIPVTIYYAYKQSATGSKGTSSTGWETFLDAVIKAGFSITGTWPVRTEKVGRVVGIHTNALASSIVLVCRKRQIESQTISRKQFIRELDEFFPEMIEEMIGGKENASPIAPVDLAQAAIGPGMAIFSKYAAVLEADGSPMSVHDALILINRAIDEYFNEAESNMEAETRFCVDWFQQYGFKEGPFGEADVLARAKGTTVDGVQNSGVIQSGGGKVRLLKIDEYPSDWNPGKDFRIPVWEACHHLCRALKESEIEAGTLLAKMAEKTEAVRQLAYRLYTLCERKGWAEDARRYNELITGWHSIVKASQDVGISHTQKELF